MGKGLELKFLRWYTDSQEAYEKTVNSASYQGKKKNQTTVNTTSHPSGWLLFKRPKKQNKTGK